LATHPNPSSSHKSHQYLRTRVMTATPEQLQMMLYDGAIRFTEAARSALDRRDLEAVFRNVTKAQAIVTELLSGLRPAHGADLCGRLAAEYRYVYRKLVEVGFQHSGESADAAIDVLRNQRETWALLLEKRGQEKADGRTRGMPSAPVVSAGLSIAA
jgi:flagellar protein FliS